MNISITIGNQIEVSIETMIVNNSIYELFLSDTFLQQLDYISFIISSRMTSKLVINKDKK